MKKDFTLIELLATIIIIAVLMIIIANVMYGGVIVK